MKKIVLCVAINFLANLSFSQTQTEIPLQNGRAYFSFKNNVESKNICASTFLDPAKNAEYLLLLKKNSQLVAQYQSNNSAKEGFSVSCYSIIKNNKNPLKCADEVRVMPGSYVFNINVSAKKKKAKLKILNEEISLGYLGGTTQLEINVKIIFKSKTEYELIFSDAYLIYAHIPKGERQPKSSRVELGEFYSNYKNSNESFPDNDLLFKTLVLSIENANKCLNQALQECINFYD